MFQQSFSLFASAQVYPVFQGLAAAFKEENVSNESLFGMSVNRVLFGVKESGNQQTPQSVGCLLSAVLQVFFHQQ